MVEKRSCKRVQFVCTGESRTKQEFRDECDINNIIKKFQRTGVLPVNGSRAIQGDFSDVPDYQTALNMVSQVEGAFAELPAKVRERFQNNAAQLMSFLDDPRNRSEAESLGLIEKKEAPTPTGAPAAKTEQNAQQSASKS